MRVSVVVCTYEAPDALDAVLRALADQSDDRFDVVVTDDGSGPGTAAVVDGWTATLGDRLSYVWQPDEGFRLASALNRGVLATHADFVVILGGDCVPRRHLVRAFRASARPGWFIATNRVLLPRSLSERVLRERTPLHRWTTTRLLLTTRGGGEARALLTARDRRRVGGEALPDFEPHGRAYCCVGVYASDFAAVNGYDARFVGWGDEDVDLAVRLHRLGLRCGHAGSDAVPLHLWHEPRATPDRPNWDLMQETVGSDRIEAVAGLRELRSELVVSRLDTQLVAGKVGVPYTASRGSSDIARGDDVAQARNGPSDLSTAVSAGDVALELTIPRQAVPGVNLVGFLQAGLGLGEVARKLARALESAELPFAAISYPRAPSGQNHPLAIEPSRVAPYDTNLICLNADYLHAFLADVGVDFFAGRRSIGVWFWESSVFRAEDLGGMRFLDEVWVASEYVRRAVAAASDIPVHVVPLPVEPPLLSVRTRAELGLPEGFLFLFAFDWVSSQRKNPGAVVEAFTRAFEPGEGPVLVMKSINGRERKPRLLDELVAATAGRPDVHIVDEYVSSEERDAIVASCDCFVSLHRSEGFGLALAEAMAHGKPVIATGYSGNLDFMDAGNSHLVPYRLIPVPEDWWAHAPGAEWAEPDVYEAAELMQRVYRSPEEARALGERGRVSVLSTFLVDRTASFVVERVSAIRNRGSAATPTAGRDPRAAILEASRELEKGVAASLLADSGGRRSRSRRLLARALWPYLAEQHRLNTAMLDALTALTRSQDHLRDRLVVLESDLSDRLAALEHERLPESVGLELARHFSPELEREIVVALPSGASDPYVDAFAAGFVFPTQLAFLLEDRRGISSFVDVGANIGQFTLTAAALGLECVAVEPESRNFVLLRAALAANGFSNVRPVHAAASDAPGVVTLEGSSAWARVDVHADEATALGTAVPAVALDELLPLCGLAAPDLVKIDVEGHEGPVLRGLQRTIDVARPLIILESNPSVLGGVSEARSLLERLEAMGYVLYLFTRDGAVVPHPSAWMQPALVVDYLAVPEERARDRALPTVRESSVHEVLLMMETEPLDQGPHVLHLCRAIAELEARNEGGERLEALKARVLGSDPKALSFIQQHHPRPMPSWLEAGLAGSLIGRGAERRRDPALHRLRELGPRREA